GAVDGDVQRRGGGRARRVLHRVFEVLGRALTGCQCWIVDRWRVRVCAVAIEDEGAVQAVERRAGGAGEADSAVGGGAQDLVERALRVAAAGRDGGDVRARRNVGAGHRHADGDVARVAAG